jgi:hypothetical protein
MQYHDETTFTYSPISEGKLGGKGAARHSRQTQPLLEAYEGNSHGHSSMYNLHLAPAALFSGPRDRIYAQESFVEYDAEHGDIHDEAKTQFSDLSPSERNAQRPEKQGEDKPVANRYPETTKRYLQQLSVHLNNSLVSHERECLLSQPSGGKLCKHCKEKEMKKKQKTKQVEQSLRSPGESAVKRAEVNKKARVREPAKRPLGPREPVPSKQPLSQNEDEQNRSGVVEGVSDGMVLEQRDSRLFPNSQQTSRSPPITYYAPPSASHRPYQPYVESVDEYTDPHVSDQDYIIWETRGQVSLSTDNPFLTTDPPIKREAAYGQDEFSALADQVRDRDAGPDITRQAPLAPPSLQAPITVPLRQVSTPSLRQPPATPPLPSHVPVRMPPSPPPSSLIVEHFTPLSKTPRRVTFADQIRRPNTKERYYSSRENFYAWAKRTAEAEPTNDTGTWYGILPEHVGIRKDEG